MTAYTAADSEAWALAFSDAYVKFMTKHVMESEGVAQVAKDKNVPKSSPTKGQYAGAPGQPVFMSLPIGNDLGVLYLKPEEVGGDISLTEALANVKAYAEQLASPAGVQNDEHAIYTVLVSLRRLAKDPKYNKHFAWYKHPIGLGRTIVAKPWHLMVTLAPNGPVAVMKAVLLEVNAGLMWVPTAKQSSAVLAGGYQPGPAQPTAFAIGKEITEATLYEYCKPLSVSDSVAKIPFAKIPELQQELQAHGEMVGKAPAKPIVVETLPMSEWEKQQKKS